MIFVSLRSETWANSNSAMHPSHGSPGRAGFATSDRTFAGFRLYCAPSTEEHPTPGIIPHQTNVHGVVVGGGWLHSLVYCRSASRLGPRQSWKDCIGGFRLYCSSIPDQRHDYADLLEVAIECTRVDGAAELADLKKRLAALDACGDKVSAAAFGYLLARKELLRGASSLEEAMESEKLNPWKARVIDALVVNFLLNEENERDPKLALHDIAEFEQLVARDLALNPRSEAD